MGMAIYDLSTKNKLKRKKKMLLIKWDKALSQAKYISLLQFEYGHVFAHLWENRRHSYIQEEWLAHVDVSL